MKTFIIKLLVIVSLPLISNAYTVIDYKLSQRSINAGCSDPEISTPGSITNYINSESFNLSSGSNEITLSFDTASRVCQVEQINGQKKYEYAVVNPFNGFEVPYFSDRTNTVQYRHEIINKLAPSNRWEVVIYNEKSGQAQRHTITPYLTQLAHVSINFKPDLLLSNDELNKINNGEVITVNLIIFQILNLTTTLDQACYQFGNRQVANSYLNLKISR